MLWSIISESDFVVSSVVRSAQALLSFHMPTGKLGSRPADATLHKILGRDQVSMFEMPKLLNQHVTAARQ